MKKAYLRIRKALQEAIAHAVEKGRMMRLRKPKPVDRKLVREQKRCQ